MTAPDDRTARYLARVERHLLTVEAPESQRAFLRALIAGWERAYARFIREPYGDTAPPCGPDAADYLLTIMGLAALLDLLEASDG
jgi:hypothetical protein